MFVIPSSLAFAQFAFGVPTICIDGIFFNEGCSLCISVAVLTFLRNGDTY